LIAKKGYDGRLSNLYEFSSKPSLNILFFRSSFIFWSVY